MFGEHVNNFLLDKEILLSHKTNVPGDIKFLFNIHCIPWLLFVSASDLIHSLVKDYSDILKRFRAQMVTSMAIGR